MKIKEFGKYAAITGLALVAAPVILVGHVVVLGIVLAGIFAVQLVLVPLLLILLPLALAFGFRDLVREHGLRGACEAVARPAGIAGVVILALLGVREILDMIRGE